MPEFYKRGATDVFRVLREDRGPIQQPTKRTSLNKLPILHLPKAINNSKLRSVATANDNPRIHPNLLLLDAKDLHVLHQLKHARHLHPKPALLHKRQLADHNLNKPQHPLAVPIERLESDEPY